MKAPKHRNTKTPKEILIQNRSERIVGSSAYPLSSEALPSMLLRDEAAVSPPYDLEERTALFGEAVIRFVKKIPLNAVNSRLIANSLPRRLVLGQTTAKPITAFPAKALETKSARVERKLVKPSSFFV